MIDYSPLWETMKKQNMTTYTLIEKHNVSKQTIYQLKHNKSVTLYTIEKLCRILQCPIEDIVSISFEDTKD